MYANGGGPGYFSIEIKAPDNSIIVGNDMTVESLFLVQYSCDKTSAPRFPDFGSEAWAFDDPVVDWMLEESRTKWKFFSIKWIYIEKIAL